MSLDPLPTNPNLLFENVFVVEKTFFSAYETFNEQYTPCSGFLARQWYNTLVSSLLKDLSRLTVLSRNGLIYSAVITWMLTLCDLVSWKNGPTIAWADQGTKRSGSQCLMFGSFSWLQISREKLAETNWWSPVWRRHFGVEDFALPMLWKGDLFVIFLTKIGLFLQKWFFALFPFQFFFFIYIVTCRLHIRLCTICPLTVKMSPLITYDGSSILLS